jgi:hypothetical protein
VVALQALLQQHGLGPLPPLPAPNKPLSIPSVRMQAWPHAPQLSTSERVSTHWPAQHVASAAQV